MKFFSVVFVFSCVAAMCVIAAPAPEPVLTIVVPAAGLTLGGTGLTVGGAIAAKTLAKIGFAKGRRHTRVKYTKWIQLLIFV